MNPSKFIWIELRCGTEYARLSFRKIGGYQLLLMPAHHNPINNINYDLLSIWLEKVLT